MKIVQKCVYSHNVNYFVSIFSVSFFVLWSCENHFPDETVLLNVSFHSQFLEKKNSKNFVIFVYLILLRISSGKSLKISNINFIKICLRSGIPNLMHEWLRWLIQQFLWRAKILNLIITIQIKFILLFVVFSKICLTLADCHK